ncbi:MAG: adenylosuccinate synthetase [Nitrososphaerota archaeon]
MPLYVVVGGFFGDEGKGKVVAYMARSMSPAIGVRGGVGTNAGHTVYWQGKPVGLRQLPSCVVNPSTLLLVGAGVLVDPEVFLGEVRAFGCERRAYIDAQCALIEERHKQADREGHLKEVIQTTGTGTGPANADRALRRVRIAREERALLPYVTDVSERVHEALERGQLVMAEGTQGTFLSSYHGTWPYVTSKDVTAAAVCSDIGVGPTEVDRVLVVFKSYVTRVGGGPLEGELSPEEMQRRGWAEFGTVTGRPRRAAPFNFRLARRAVKLNGATDAALTKADALAPEAKGVRSYEKLPAQVRRFVEEVEAEIGVPVSLIGTGPEPEDIIDRWRA